MSYKLYDAEIEYLESTGTQYINLGSTLNSSTDVIDIEFCMTEELAGAYKLFGARSGASEKNYSIITSNPNGICIDLQNATYSTYRATYTYEVGVYYAVHMERTLRRASSNGVIVAEKTIESQSFTTAVNAYLFSFNQSGNNWLLAPCRIKSFTWKRNNLNFINLIPVRVGNVGYMYDKVSGQLFGNAGTGSFVLGQDVAPGRYANEIAFLESTGSQYIDTLFYPRTTNTDITVEVKFNKSVLSGDHCVLGARTGAEGSQGFKLPNFCEGTLECQGLTPAGSGTGGGNLPGTYSINTDYVLYAELKQNSQKFYVNDTLKLSTSYSGNCDAGGNLYLFAMHQSGTKWYFNGKIYYCKIWEDDVLVRDFIPVEYNNIGYLYDKVSGEFFANQGTGKFVLGHRAPRFDGKACARSYTRRQLMMDTVAIKPYISDGLVFHLDGADATSTNWVDRVAGMVYALDGATPNNEGTGVNFNISNNSCVATLVGSAPSSVSSVRGKTGTIEICMYRRALRTNYLEFIFQTNRYSIAYLTDSGNTNIVFTGTSNGENYKAPRGLLPNGRELGFITHSYNAVTTCYKGKEVAVGANTYKTAYEWTIGNNTSKGNPFKGTIYQIRIYNRQLSLDEMKFNQEQDRKRYGI